MALIKAAETDGLMQEAIVLDFGDLQRQAERMKAQAQARAEQIVDEARQEAAQLVAGAREQGRAEGLDAGRAEGLEIGRKEGHDEALKQTAQKLDGLQKSWARALEQWEAQRSQMMLEARQSLLALALALAEKVVRRAPVVDPSIVVDQVAEAIGYVTRPTALTVRIHPDDRATLTEALEVVLQQCQVAEHVELVDDPSLQRGGCTISYGKGSVDATLDGRLQRLIEALMPVDQMQQTDPSDQDGQACEENDS